MTALSFITGCPRSGTTFLVRALQPARDAEVLAGLVFPPHLAHLAATTSSTETNELLERSLHWSLEFFAAYTGRSRTWAAGEAVRGNRRLRDLGRQLRRGAAPSSVVYKEPFLAFAPRLAYQASPDSRIVVLHRDGRDCADSLQRKYAVLTDDRLRSFDSVEAALGRRLGERVVPWWVDVGAEQRFLAASPFVRSVWMWREMARRCIEFLADDEVRSSGRVLTVPYHELVGNPVETGTRIASHFGLEMNRRIEQRLRRAHSRSIGAHTDRDEEEVARATELAAAELRHWGYL